MVYCPVILGLSVKVEKIDFLILALLQTLSCGLKEIITSMTVNSLRVKGDDVR